MPDPDTFRVLPYAPHTGARAHRPPRRSTATPAAGLPALVPQADAGAAGRARAGAARGVRERVLAGRSSDDGDYVPIDSGLCFSTISMTASQDYADALVDALEAQRHPARAVLRRARARPAGDLHRPRAGAAGGRRAAAGARDDPRRGSSLGLVASLAPKPWPDNAGNGGHIHFSLWEGDRNRFYDGARALRTRLLRATGARVHRRRARASARAVRPDRAELQLLPPDRPAATGPARSPAGATTTARRRCACRRRSAAPRRRRPTPS